MATRSILRRRLAVAAATTMLALAASPAYAAATPSVPQATATPAAELASLDAGAGTAATPPTGSDDDLGGTGPAAAATEQPGDAAATPTAAPSTGTSETGTSATGTSGTGTSATATPASPGATPALPTSEPAPATTNPATKVSGAPKPAVSRVAAAATAGVPTGNPPSGQAKLVVTVGGDRRADGTVGPLAGATFDFYSVGSPSALTGGTNVGSCTTDATGRCGAFVGLTRTCGFLFWTYDCGWFYAVQTAAPSGWSVAQTWGSSSDLVRFNTGEISADDSAADRTVTLPGSGRTWPTVRDNPRPPARCGLRIAMVFDLSNSVTDSSTLMAQYRNAGQGFVDALTGTPSSIAVYTFATAAPAAGSANATLDPTSVATPGGAATVKSKIAGLQDTPNTNDGGTNWDRGLAQVPSGFDAVVFLTDGDPTFAGSPASGPGNATNLSMVEEAVHSANKVKATGARMLVVGFGGSVDSAPGRQRLSLISGPVQGDDYYTSGFGALNDVLKELATKACKGTLTVVKRVQLANGTQVTGTGWTFSSSTALVSPATGSTDANGTLNFAVDGYSDSVTSRSVTITEAQKPGYRLLADNGRNAVCTNTVNGSPVPATNVGTTGFTVTVPRDGVVSCTVVNQEGAPALTIVKTAAAYNNGNPVTDPANAPSVRSGTSVTWTYTVRNTGNVTITGITLVDDRIGPVACPATQLGVGQSMACTATGPVTALSHP